MNPAMMRPMMPSLSDEGGEDAESETPPEPKDKEESSEDVGHVAEMVADLSPEERKLAYDLLCKEFDQGAKEMDMKDFES